MPSFINFLFFFFFPVLLLAKTLLLFPSVLTAPCTPSFLPARSSSAPSVTRTLWQSAPYFREPSASSWAVMRILCYWSPLFSRSILFRFLLSGIYPSSSSMSASGCSLKYTAKTSSKYSCGMSFLAFRAGIMVFRALNWASLIS